jgi:hypothetical protein
LLLKLVQDGARGQNEAGLYERLRALTAHAAENGESDCEKNGETTLIHQLYGLGT